MSTINCGIGSAFLKFAFQDDDGETIASFRMNPADVKLAQRCKELSDYFTNLSKNTDETETLEDAVKMNDELESKACYLLGYDARESLFGFVSATAIMPDGNMFIVHVMNKITEAVSPEIRKRQKAMEKAVNKHTANYRK